MIRRSSFGLIRASSIIKTIIIYSLITNYCIATFHFSSSLFYFNDVLNILLFLAAFRKIIYRTNHSVYSILCVLFILLVGYSLVGLLINGYSPLLYLWGFRNNYRFFFFFFACCACLDRDEVCSICSMFAKLLPFNVVLCTLQYFQLRNSGDARVLKFLGDYIGGLFGAAQGSNRIMNVYLLFVFCWYTSKILQKKISLVKYVSIFASCFYIVILSELKIAFFEFILAGGILILLVSKKVHKIVYFVLGGCLIITGVNVWSAFNPGSAKLLSSLTEMLNYASASTYGANSLNRLTVIPQMKQVLFSGDTIGHLLGLGLGNADTSAYSFLTSKIYNAYGYLRYNFFMHGMLYIETGIIGLFGYSLYFIVGFYKSVTRVIAKRNKEDALLYAGTVFYLIALICIFYNTTLRNEVSAYLSFFFMSIPFVWANTEQQCSECE